MKPTLVLSLLLAALSTVCGKPAHDISSKNRRVDRKFSYIVPITAQVDAGSSLDWLPHYTQHYGRHPQFNPNYDFYWSPVYKTVLYRGNWITVQWNALNSCFGYEQHDGRNWKYFVEVLPQDCFDGSRYVVITVRGKTRYVFYNTLLDHFGYYPYSPLLIPFRVVTPPSRG